MEVAWPYNEEIQKQRTGWAGMVGDDKILLHHVVLRSNRKVMLVIHVFLPGVRNCLFQTDVYILSQGLIQFPAVLGTVHLPRERSSLKGM